MPASIQQGYIGLVTGLTVRCYDYGVLAWCKIGDSRDYCFGITGLQMKIRALIIVVMASLLAGCASTYYNTLDKAGIHKRDILVSRVENTRDSQEEAQDEFKDALEQFGSIVALQETDLKQAYDKLSAEYEDSQDAAEEVTDRINSVENVAGALFKEW